MEKHAEKWYFELRESRYRYVAMFRESIDSLLSYQKKLHEIISSTSIDSEGELDQKPEVKIKAISELHAIEVTLFEIWKQLPNLYVNNSIIVNHAPVSVNAATEPEEERGDGGLFIKKGSSPTMTSTFMTGKRRSCGLIIPAYLAKKYELNNRDNQVGLYVEKEEDGIFIKKLIL